MKIQTEFGWLQFLGRSNWGGRGSLANGQTLWSVDDDFNYMALAEALKLDWKIWYSDNNYYEFVYGEYGEEGMRVYLERDNLDVISSDYTTILHPRLVIMQDGNMLLEFVKGQIKNSLAIKERQVYRIRRSNLYRTWQDENINSDVLIGRIVPDINNANSFHLSEGDTLFVTGVMMQDAIVESNKIVLIYGNCIETEALVFQIEPLVSWTA